ncbi:MAG TPA: SDR family NAD(P)-dependent oxidoreductase [Aliidongia sp.]|nr:SDR family NAD(P)-dependent oxidoreductase [Aliidongia sp.]
MDCRLDQRVALITGASSGIGEATARAFAQAGAKVAVSARRQDRLESLVAMIRDQGGEAHAIVADFADDKAAKRAVEETERHFGKLDILVNNAGVMYLEPVIDADMDRWRHMLELNVLGLIAATQAALPGMRARREGHIVNISSTAGRVGSPSGAGYSATKYGVVGFSEAFRKEVYKDNIRVTVVEPGVVETELRDHVAHAGAQKAIQDFAGSMRQLQSVDIADTILFAVSRPAHVNINEILIRPTDQER